MHEPAFRKHLQREGRSRAAIERCVKYTAAFESWLGREPVEASAEELARYVAVIEADGGSARTELWALGHYFAFTAADELGNLAKEMRAARIQAKPYGLSGFAGTDPQALCALDERGIRNTAQLLAAAGTSQLRAQLADETGTAIASIENLYELSRLATIRGVRDIRARLYRGAVGTLDDMADMDSDALIAAATAYIAKTGFAGIPPTPKEAAFTVAEAKRLRDS